MHYATIVSENGKPLFDTKPLSESDLDYCSLDHWKQIANWKITSICLGRNVKQYTSTKAYVLWKRGLYTWNWNVTDKFTSTNTLTCLHNFIDSNNDLVPNRWQVIIWTILDYGTSPVPSISNVTWRCRKNFSQWERCFHWKLPCHWLKFLKQRRIAVVILGPLSRTVQEYSKYKRLPSHSILRIFKPQGDICGYVIG